MKDLTNLSQVEIDTQCSQGTCKVIKWMISHNIKSKDGFGTVNYVLYKSKTTH